MIQPTTINQRTDGESMLDVRIVKVRGRRKAAYRHVHHDGRTSTWNHCTVAEHAEILRGEGFASLYTEKPLRVRNSYEGTVQ